MANRIVLGALTGVRPAIPPETDDLQTVDRMIAFWRGRLEAVAPDRPDLVVMPELIDRPPTFDHARTRAYIAARGDRFLDAFRETAARMKCHLVVNTLRRVGESDAFVNASVILDRRGEAAGVYDKRHVTFNEREDLGALCGTGAAPIELDFGRVVCAICFDLNFDDLFQAYAAARPDLLVFSSMYHGGMMQAYRAYQCRCHFAGAIARGLPSAILSPQGEVLGVSTNYTHQATVRVNLDARLAHFDCNRPRFERLKARYGRGVTIHDPGLLGSALVTCEEEGLSADEMLREFGIEPLDDYFARARAMREDPANLAPPVA